MIARCLFCGGGLFVEPCDSNLGIEELCALCGRAPAEHSARFRALATARVAAGLVRYAEPPNLADFREPPARRGRPPGTQNRGSDQLYAEMERRRAAGETIEQVARAIGWTPKGVCNALRRLRERRVAG